MCLIHTQQDFNIENHNHPFLELFGVLLLLLSQTQRKKISHTDVTCETYTGERRVFLCLEGNRERARRAREMKRHSEFLHVHKQ